VRSWRRSASNSGARYSGVTVHRSAAEPAWSSSALTACRAEVSAPLQGGQAEGHGHGVAGQEEVGDPHGRPRAVDMSDVSVPGGGRRTDGTSALA